MNPVWERKATYIQETRNLQVFIDGLEGTDDSGNDKALLAAVLPGSFEALSQPYQLRLQLLSPATSSVWKVEEMPCIDVEFTSKLRYIWKKNYR
ncbi:MAG: hypothetical protein GY750_06295 [Lentisphaerae bacterium]|nr:hypothetical protein [Lentisphaerota bacterium]MCP4101018.1 hypothetical protein [Lentisphaerota bacterium]